MMRENNRRQNEISWWKRRTYLEKCLFLILILSIIGLIILIIFQFKVEKSTVCLTPGCVQAASKLIQNIDDKIDPCDDFYQFACGNFIKNTDISASGTSVSALTETENLVAQQISSILETPVNTDDIQAYALLKSFYQSCMDLDSIDKNAVDSFKHVIQKLGIWPIFQSVNWKEDEFDLGNLLSNFRNTGLEDTAIFSLTVETDDKNSSRNVLTLTQPVVSFSERYTKEEPDKILKYYFKYAVEILTKLGANRTVAQKEMDEVFKLEKNLAKILVPYSEQRDSWARYNPMTLDQLKEKYPFVDWVSYVRKLLPDRKVDGKFVIIVALPRYFEKLKTLLETIPKRVLANFLFWKVTRDSVMFLNREFRDMRLGILKELSGVTTETPRKKFCLQQAENLLEADSSIYVKHFFNKESKIKTYEMMKDIQKQFRNTLETVDWIDGKTRQKAIDKLDSLRFYVGYPDELLDAKILEDYYKDLEIISNDYLQSELNINAFRKKKKLEKLYETVKKDDWTSQAYSIKINAYYNPNENSVQITAAILQGVYFNNERPNYLNYGAVGSMIGHEISHAFDDQGRQYDKEGVLNNWWEPATEAAYNAKAKCIVDQYSSIFVPEVNLTLDGVHSQGENIADNGGLKHAYLAYKEWTNRNGPEPKLPGLSYTPEQLFWVSFANAWCKKTNKAALAYTIHFDEHPPDSYRLLETVKNSEYFARDFKCPSGSKMNPTKKCELW